MSPARRLTTAEIMSTSSNPTKFDQRNCAEANDPPTTRSAGQTARVCRQEVIVRTSQNGMISDNGGKIRPAVALRASTSRLVTFERVRIGVPIAPQATGAVLAIRQSRAAWNGRNPRPTRKAAEIATGAPKPAAPSMNAPKLNATSTACTRRSPDRCAIDAFITSNWPVWTAIS